VGAPLDHGQVVFFRDLETELAVLPALRRTALVSGASALAFALLVGTIFAARLSRPVSELADAAEGFASGHPDTPLRPSAIIEVRRLSEAFAAMRSTLAARLRELEDRQERLSVLQAELVQRERLAASGRLLAQLAHEIRNPVASVRNCLEVVRRKGDLTGEPAEFADMAVDELLRMHELAERMLDLHRPRDPGDRTCRAAGVARETAQLASAGAPPGTAGVSVVGGDGLRAAMAPDALKQVLLNLVLNAREVSPSDAPVEIVVAQRDDRVRLEVLDRGPGIPDAQLTRLFDPFFTTKQDVQGVGLGLYTAEGLVRAAGGTLTASNRKDGPGARFVIDLPMAQDAPGEGAPAEPAPGRAAGVGGGTP
jgi:two-component system sensor histidine kinase PilS (NtrC family)